jgi:ADP-ribose pyrophosphatase YjhB (NUDIX family)
MKSEKLSAEMLRLHKGISFVGISVVFFLHDGKGRIFLNKRSAMARDEHGMWSPGGGGVKHGQSIEANMLRELREEFDVDSLKTEFLGYFDVFKNMHTDQPSHWLAMCFAVLVNPDDVKINEPEMVDEAGWFTLDTMPLPLHSQFGPFFEKLDGKLRAAIASAG